MVEPLLSDCLERRFVREVSMRPAVFLDRDGVLTIPEFRHGRSFAPLTLEDFSIYPEAPAAVQRLSEAGFLLIVVTNQPDVAYGRIQRETLEEMHRKLHSLLCLDDIQVCSHGREDKCNCRKPLPGMIARAANRLNVDLANSFLIGDRASDIEAGRSAGCRTVFVDRYYTSEPKPEDPDFICSDVAQAADWILSLEEKLERSSAGSRAKVELGGI